MDSTHPGGGTIATPPPLPPVTPGDPPRPVREDLPRGTVLGDYRVESKLGAGGMGDVYLGVNQMIGKRAAIKVLKADLCTDKFSVERFIAEARVVNQIGHPNIVDVFAFGQTPDGRSFLVMELLQGATLRERIAHGKVGLGEICAIVRPLVRALAAAHAQGVVHRDLKPDNVFLVAVPGERTATVKLLDFGIAKLVTSDQMQQTASGALVGTPMYLAPEQARAQTIDHRADIYTLGGIVFEMLTGRPPFLAATSFEVVAKHLMEPPEHPSTFAPVPAVLDALVVNMLAKEPAARPTLDEVLRVIESVGDPKVTAPLAFERDSYHSIAVTERRPAPVVAKTLPPRPRSRRFVIVAASLVIAGGVAAFAIVATQRDTGDAQPTPAQPVAAPRAPADSGITVSPIIVAPIIVPVDASVETVAPPPAIDAGLPRRGGHVDKVPVGSAAPATVAPQPPPPHAGSAIDDEHLIPRGSVTP